MEPITDNAGPAFGPMPAGHHTVPRPTRYWIGILAILLLLTEQSALGFTMIAPSLPHIAGTFKTAQVVWVMTAFTLSGVVASPIIGKLADRYGKQKMLGITAAISAVGALISATAPTFPILVAGRFVSGVGFACMALGYTLIRDIFPSRLQATAIGLANTGVGFVGVVSMVLAGAMIDHLGVRSVFWFAFGFCALGGLLTLWLVPETPIRSHSQIDWGGAFMLAVSMFVLMLALSRGAIWGWTSRTTLICFVVAAIGLAVWVAWELRVSEPLIRLDLIALPAMRYVLIGGGIAYGATTLMATVMPMLLQSPKSMGYGHGLSTTHQAIWMMPGQLMIVASGFIASVAAKSLGYRRILVIGAATLALSAALFAVVPTAPAALIALWGLFGLGCMIYAAVPNIALRVLPETERAVGSNFVGVSQTAAGTVLSAIGFAVLDQYSTDAHREVAYQAAGFRGVFIVAAVAAAIGAVVALAIPRKTGDVAL